MENKELNNQKFTLQGLVSKSLPYIIITISIMAFIQIFIGRCLTEGMIIGIISVYKVFKKLFLIVFPVIASIELSPEFNEYRDNKFKRYRLSEIVSNHRIIFRLSSILLLATSVIYSYDVIKFLRNKYSTIIILPIVCFIFVLIIVIKDVVSDKIEKIKMKEYHEYFHGEA